MERFRLVQSRAHNSSYTSRYRRLKCSMYSMAAVDKSMLANLQGPARLRLYKSFRGWLWQKPLPSWGHTTQGRAVGSSKVYTGFSACWTDLFGSFRLHQRQMLLYPGRGKKMMDEEQQIWLRVLVTLERFVV